MSGNSDPWARSRVDRLLAMIDDLRREPMTVDEMAEEYRVSRRTVFRDLCAIERRYPLDRTGGVCSLPRRLVFPGGCCRLCGQPMAHGEAA